MENHPVIYTPYGDAKIAHPETFETLDDGVAMYGGAYGPEGYGRDVEFVYFFTYTTETSYACDNKHIFWGNRLVEADLDSFKVLDDGDAEDKYRYFFNGITIKKKV